MRQAMEEWKGKGEAGQLILLNADLHLSKGDPDGALQILNKVRKECKIFLPLPGIEPGPYG